MSSKETLSFLKNVQDLHMSFAALKNLAGGQYLSELLTLKEENSLIRSVVT
jgi:hypothetical protein